MSKLVKDLPPDPVEFLITKLQLLHRKRKVGTPELALPPSARRGNKASMECSLVPSNTLIPTTKHCNPLPTIGNSLKKQKSLYKVLTPSIKPLYKFFMGTHDAYMRHWLVNG